MGASIIAYGSYCLSNPITGKTLIWIRLSIVWSVEASHWSSWYCWFSNTDDLCKDVCPNTRLHRITFL